MSNKDIDVGPKGNVANDLMSYDGVRFSIPMKQYQI